MQLIINVIVSYFLLLLFFPISSVVVVVEVLNSILCRQVEVLKSILCRQEKILCIRSLQTSLWSRFSALDKVLYDKR